MPRPTQSAHANSPFSEKAIPYVVVYAKGEIYMFRYHQGQEIALISCLMDYAADPRYRIGWNEVLRVIRKLGL